jgi:pimeloyl-ACP methyl ester carboxylesterase
VTTTTSAPARRVTVLADDGARLAVWVHEPLAARSPCATVVLAHGWALSHRSWDRVVPLVQEGAPVRVVTYDQRGHGESTLRGPRPRGPHRGQRLGQRLGRRLAPPSVRALGDDLASVIQAVCPDGPLVLGGHSMGGMTVMAYSGTHPADVRARVRGVALVSTSAGDLRGMGRPGEVALMRTIAHLPGLRPGRAVTIEGQRRLLFGPNARPTDVAATRQMVASTPLATIGRYYTALTRHDEAAALATLATVPTRVLVGDHDRLTPVSHARRLAELVPHAELEVLPGAGHMLGFEAPDAVAHHLLRLLDGVA